MSQQDGAGKPSKTRKPPMPEFLRPFIAEARERNKRRPASPGVTLERGPDGYRMESPHRDLEAWEVQICDAFGTRSYSTMSIFLNQLCEICPTVRDEHGDHVASELYLNAALNIVSGVRPRNEVEACLALQMVTVHFLTMQVAKQTLGKSWTDSQTSAIAGKLARTFAMQCDALAKLKGKTGRQHITVRSDRHYHDHRHIHAEAAGGGVKNGGRPRGPSARPEGLPTIEHEAGSALPGPDEARDGLPVPCDAGAQAVSHPRGRRMVGGA
jgi:hypothetical protein